MKSIVSISKKYFLMLSAFLWIGITFLNLSIFYTENTLFDQTIFDFIVNIGTSLLFVSNLLFFRAEVEEISGKDPKEYLLRVFYTGISAIIIIIFLKFLIKTEIIQNLILITFFYQVNLGLIAIFIASAFYAWKKLILYHQSYMMGTLWNILETFVFLLTLSTFFIFDLNSYSFYIILSPIIILSLILIFNIKWIAFLNKKEKIQSIIFSVLIFLVSLIFLQQIYEHELNNDLILNLWDNLYIDFSFIFISIYSFVSSLVLMFHIPTSTLFDRKIEELKIFQNLNSAIQERKSSNEIHHIILKSGIDAVEPSVGWLEMVDEKGNFTAFINKGIDNFDIFEIKKVLRKNHILSEGEPNYIKHIQSLNYSERIGNMPYKSLIQMPILSNNSLLGSLVVLKNEKAGFNKSSLEILKSFAEHAGTAIRNFKLIQEALDNQRYKEELSIAKEVQKKLLPDTLNINPNLWIYTVSQSADDIGGDYFDIYNLNDHKKTCLIIGDVSGHGTTAAFNMAQMKGVFQSLVPLNLSHKDFLASANRAISACFEKRFFITVSLLTINTENKSFKYSRAGHCHSFYYHIKSETIEKLESKGLGLGIVRNEKYDAHIYEQNYQYQSGDIILLYTDGILEVTNPSGEEFGEERLVNAFKNSISYSPQEIGDYILKEVNLFIQGQKFDDDYTVIILKFI